MIVEAPTIRPLERRIYKWEWNPCGKDEYGGGKIKRRIHG